MPSKDLHWLDELRISIFRFFKQKVGPRATVQVLQNSGNLMFMLRVKPYQREIATEQVQNIIESGSKRGNI